MMQQQGSRLCLGLFSPFSVAWFAAASQRRSNDHMTTILVRKGSAVFFYVPQSGFYTCSWCKDSFVVICYLDWKVAVTKDVMFVITSRSILSQTLLLFLVKHLLYYGSNPQNDQMKDVCQTKYTSFLTLWDLLWLGLCLVCTSTQTTKASAQRSKT